MAKYLEIRNAKQNIVIDDQFRTPTFLRKIVISGGFTEIGAPVAGAQNLYSWKYRQSVAGIYTPDTCRREFGLEPSVLARTNESELHMVFAKNTLNTAFFVTADMRYVTSDNAFAQGTKAGDVYVSITAYTDDVNSAITVSLYTNNTRIPATFGKQAFDAQGKITFDAVRGVISNIGVMSGAVNLNQEIAATYSFVLPEGCDPSNVFISQRSTIPIRVAYKIGSGGVSMSWSKFAPVMTINTASNSLIVRLTRQNNLSGSNSASNIGGYFENVIY